MGSQQTKNFGSVVSFQEQPFQNVVIGSNLKRNFSEHSELLRIFCFKQLNVWLNLTHWLQDRSLLERHSRATYISIFCFLIYNAEFSLLSHLLVVLQSSLYLTMLRVPSVQSQENDRDQKNNWNPVVLFSCCVHWLNFDFCNSPIFQTDCKECRSECCYFTVKWA